MNQPMDLEQAVVTAWRGTHDEMPGVRQIVDHYRSEPTDAAMAEAMARATAKEQIMLAAMAGRSSVQDAAAARVGEAIEQRARTSGRDPATHRADPGRTRASSTGSRRCSRPDGRPSPTAPGADAPSLAARAAPSLRVGPGAVCCRIVGGSLFGPRSAMMET